MNLANKLTILRMVLVPIIVIIPFFNISGSLWGVPLTYIIMDIIFIIGSCTDKLDGYLARKRTYTTVPDTEGDSTDAYTYSGAFRKNSGFTIGTATVSSDNMTATFTPELEVPEYPVTFLVKDSSDSTPIAGAKITIEGNSYLTDANGIVSTDLPADTYSNINVEKEGYTAQADVEITVANKALVKEISLVKAV